MKYCKICNSEMTNTEHKDFNGLCTMGCVKKDKFLKEFAKDYIAKNG